MFLVRDDEFSLRSAIEDDEEFFEDGELRFHEGSAVEDDEEGSAIEDDESRFHEVSTIDGDEENFVKVPPLKTTKKIS
ncbi:hypothetical protein L6452_36502 [Arctium lappa]|uniref:Uncharacterized protein n=1 Tax=Arctium lappa TaxID=4217 RepID=A0ACB8YAH8_ARCLA|nr:hypothetical protein L6452_36502 [Arctium lappa]